MGSMDGLGTNRSTGSSTGRERLIEGPSSGKAVEAYTRLDEAARLQKTQVVVWPLKHAPRIGIGFPHAALQLQQSRLPTSDMRRPC